jgi:hypothetical protein
VVSISEIDTNERRPSPSQEQITIVLKGFQPFFIKAPRPRTTSLIEAVPLDGSAAPITFEASKVAHGQRNLYLPKLKIAEVRQGRMAYDSTYHLDGCPTQQLRPCKNVRYRSIYMEL